MTRSESKTTSKPKPEIDYSLYLVTSRDLLPPGKDYYESLEESLQGGVTLVQVREKETDTGEFIEIARRTKEICDKYNVPVLINDRIDVHLAIGKSLPLSPAPTRSLPTWSCKADKPGSAGIHIGQSDTPLAIARSLLGPNAIIGVSVQTPAEATTAVRGGADYVGIGPVWPTGSKDVSKKVLLGPEGVGSVLDVLAGTGVKAVAIGGIHGPNLAHLLHASISPQHRNYLSGIAIISDIVSSRTPQAAAKALHDTVDSYHGVRIMMAAIPSVFPTPNPTPRDPVQMLEWIGRYMEIVRKKTPLIHQITNNVVINDSANATLAVGASPIMATNPRDCKDLSPAIGALLVNFGTITDKEGMMVAGRQANVNRKPLVFDPVAVGATSYRRETSKAHWQPTVIKGNAAEIAALAQSTEVATRGVDSVGTGFSDPVKVVMELAKRRTAIIVLTGKDDYISDGLTCVKVSNGHELLGVITGSGCMTGTLIATFCAAARLYDIETDSLDCESNLVRGDMLLGALAGVLVFNIAAEVAAARPDVKGPGTFRAALMDELYNLTPEVVTRRAKIDVICTENGPAIPVRL